MSMLTGSMHSRRRCLQGPCIWPVLMGAQHACWQPLHVMWTACRPVDMP